MEVDLNWYADPNLCGAARISGPHYVVVARNSSYVAFYNQPYIFTKKCDKNILSSKLYPESSNDEDIKCL